MKRDYSSVHPELQQFAKYYPTIRFNRKTLWLFRLMDKILPARKPPADISVENVFIPREESAASLRLIIYRSTSLSRSNLPVLVWFHGGGYIIGSPEQDDNICIEYVREAGIIVISVDYRVAPEHPFPAALNDANTALKWIKINATQLGIDPERIAVGGASAGSGLAASLAQLACDRNEVKPVFQLLVYPMLDDRTCTRTDLLGRYFFIWNLADNLFGWQSYLGKDYGANEMPLYAVPSRRMDLSGLPPAWIGVGALDLFIDEDIAYAQKLEECGVPCELIVVAGAFHGFDVAGVHLNVVKEFRASQVAALKKYLWGN